MLEAFLLAVLDTRLEAISTALLNAMLEAHCNWILRRELQPEACLPTKGGISDDNPPNVDGSGKRGIFADLKAGRQRGHICALSFARAHYLKIIDTMWVLTADVSFARVHYVKIVATMWVLDADLSFARDGSIASK